MPKQQVTLNCNVRPVPCESIQAVNTEIGALKQHQDPAADRAAEENKEIARILDPTGAGNTSNVLDDEEGYIFTQELLVPDVTEEEILAIVDAAGLVEEVNEEVKNDREVIKEKHKKQGGNNRNNNNNAMVKIIEVVRLSSRV
ncbi:hypothetical protein BDZ91DRAFT_850325 [Kalaharituber pfeilii]|nr:hypothetical protein BDZ91DRAFT_850325 [Kalaharituber pfeilii]